jgi:hypothetical protein
MTLPATAARRHLHRLARRELVLAREQREHVVLDLVELGVLLLER